MANVQNMMHIYCNDETQAVEDAILNRLGQQLDAWAKMPVIAMSELNDVDLDTCALQRARRRAGFEEETGTSVEAARDVLSETAWWHAGSNL